MLEPLLEASFSESSYGFRPGRNQEQAVKAAQKVVREGRRFVVDIDLSKFFDRVHHDRLIQRLSRYVPDNRILRLIGVILRSGIMKDGLVSATREGTVQGSPLSPLLSNVVLTELDEELTRRELPFCRYADDCNIFVRTRKAAERVMQSISKFIEGKLKLLVNREKSKVAQSSQVKFLGMTIIAGMIAISSQSINRAMERAKELTPRGRHVTLEKAIDKINRWYTGWSGYYRMTQYPSQLAKIEAHIRRRLRSSLVEDHKQQRSLFKKLVKRGVSKGLAGQTVYSNKGRWALSHTRAVERAYSNQWFIHTLGLKIRSNESLAHWEDPSIWVKVT
jgi:group II intron reverse transcriptase/maturase